MASVPGNALQRRIQKVIHQSKRSTLLGRKNIRAEIIEAYDSEKIKEMKAVAGELPIKLARLSDREPGTLFARVKILKNGKELYLPFMASEAEILSSHGNSVLLKGMQCTIVHNGLHKEDGKLSISGEFNMPLKDEKNTNIFDVVGLIS